MKIKPVKGKCKIPDKKQMGDIDWGQRMCQSAKQSRDDFKDVHGLEDLSLNNFPEEILRQCFFRNALLNAYRPSLKTFLVTL